MMCLICTLTAILPVKAADSIDTSKKGSLTVTFCPEDIPASGVEFRLYKVASVDEYADLELTAGFAGISEDFSEPDEDVWENAVTEVESYISENGIKPDYTAVSDENGVAVFSGLPVGLYLLKADAFISEEHDAYTPQAYLIMLPERIDDEWSYDLQSVPKYEKSDEITDITVTKKWDGGKVEDRPETITVTLYCDDVEYETVSFGAAEDWKHTWEQLNAKHSWTISEVSVEGYTTTIEPDGYSFIITNVSEKKDLPQTGLVWWPVPLLAAAGVGFSLTGIAVIKKSRKTDEK